MNKLEIFQKKIGYEFKNEGLLIASLTHSSYANEKRRKNIIHNERLEFLGDSVLGLVITGEIFNHSMRLPEGELTRIRAAIVCESSLKTVADKLDLGDFIYLGKGEIATGGKTRTSILSDAVEAIIGSIYLDGGFEKAKFFVLSNMSEIIKFAFEGKIFKDYKTQLQEVLQKNQGYQVSYTLKSEKGPDHKKIFEVEASINGEKFATGLGRTKKEAEREAAKLTLEMINDK